ncbi:hypothetical protein M440DRAFT_1389561 [Trichoderma longibrachiatum ATCC 18648]|uniref:Protein kinase domain-containing protein n=1 Tax=Trichoderma longibrachiatum ATCC 18648 TaxID=983965 RepID=A0A2T4CDG0_TRILO|nr:hypothetical protein M440DRAFT_1389561 [Trichoderma longibrachiatum ATCC 18648]
MAEVLGTALGVVGFIGQLFDGCVKAYGYFTTAANLDADSQRMLCKTDKDKFANLLKDLKDFNDGLEALFPPSQVPSFQRAWTHHLLDRAQRDVAELSLLENASSGIYPQLTNSATLKKLRINLDSKPQASFKPTFALRIGLSSLEIPPEATSASSSSSSSSRRRCQAHHVTAGNVLIEWIDYDRDEVDERVAHVRRLDDLARMMHSASESHPDLHSIDCLGYTDDTINSRYGLVYKAPSSSHSSLDALIASPDLKTPDLDARVRLAATLAVALWSLHSLDWLHKSLCSSNILFFPSAFSASGLSPTAAAALRPDVSNPYLAGFAASRPDLDVALSVAPRNPSIEHLHRHPASLRGGPHVKPYDVYSFGLVLLEIGLWKVLQTYYKAHYSAERWRDKVVLAVLVPGLGSKVGRRYREVVEMCLRVDEGMSSSEAGELMEEVVNKLESIRV